MNVLDSIAEAALAMPEGDGGEFLLAVSRYLLTGEEPDTGSMGVYVRAMWIATFPVLHKSRSRSENGSKGGSSKGQGGPEAKAKQTPSKPEAKAKQTPSEREAKSGKAGSEQVSSSHSPSNQPSRREGEGDLVEPPALDEVRGYFAANLLKGDPEEFFDHYEAQGWVRGNGLAVCDWRAQARSWHRMQVQRDHDAAARASPARGMPEVGEAFRPVKSDGELLAELEAERLERGWADEDDEAAA